MKIINLEQFKKMPTGTIFTKYKPCTFSGLMVLTGHSETTIDFYYVSLIENIDSDDPGDFVNKCEEMQKGISHKLDFECTAKDGMFSENQLFAIYEKQDVIDFIYKLTDSLIGCFKIGLKDLWEFPKKVCDDKRI